MIRELQKIYEQMAAPAAPPKTKPAPTRTPQRTEPSRPTRTTPFGPRPDRVGKPAPKPKNDSNSLKDRIKAIFQRHIG